MRLTGIFFQQKIKINNLKNRLEGIENKTNEINKFLNTIS